MVFPRLTHSILFILLLASCSFLSDRRPAAIDVCRPNGVGCPFLIIGHRGAPNEEAENTIPSFKEALRQGANALEIDLVMTAEGEVAVYHDRNPNELVSLIRQAGLERHKYIPHLPGIGSNERVPTEYLTLDELRRIYGYALSKGIFGDIFTKNEKDPDAIIPTIEEFSLWANEQDSLEAVFLDIKLVPGQEALAPAMADKFARSFGSSRFRVYMLTPHVPIYEAIQEWITKNPKAPNRYLTLDMEEEGALDRSQKIRNKLKKKVKSLALGSTILRSWSAYKKELEQILDRAHRKNDGIYPVVSWTVDDEQKLYQLLQMGVDGILTNRPERLHRLLNRHWQDHSAAAKTLATCYDKAKRQGPWIICTSGAQLAPLVAIGQDQLRRWACSEPNLHPTLKDFYGCGGIFDKVNIRFSTKLENDAAILMYTSPQGSVEVTKLPRTPTENDQMVFLEYNQSKCNDGVLNYKCEYQLQAEYKDDNQWHKLGNPVEYKDSFSKSFLLPKSAQELRLHLSETDDGEVEDQVLSTFTIKNGLISDVKSPSKTFRGHFKLITRDMAPWLKAIETEKIVALEFLERKCNDGILNYKCEYKLSIEAITNDGSHLILHGDDKSLKGSFIIEAHIPNGVKALSLTLTEMDGSELSAESKIYLELEHGSSMSIDSGDGTFAGDFTFKFLDYDESREHSEGTPGFNPHNQKDREKIIYKMKRPH